MNERQTQICDAATTLFLKEGVGVSTASIAKAAAVSNGTLFNAFPTKQALIDAVYRRAKLGMFAALGKAADGPFTRAQLYANWQTYLAWARTNPEMHAVMHLLLESGLASAPVKAEIDALAAPYGASIAAALENGVIHGPNPAFISKLILVQLDLVLSENLNSADADLAFDMLCNAIGLAK
ncbi:MAG: TetR/AcrR family transcriptional regulator [Pseudomonadota bacterium]